MPRTRVPRVGAAPRIVTFPRQQARHVRVSLESADHAILPAPIRALSVLDGSSPSIDLALRKQVSASSMAPGGSIADNPMAPASAVDGNPCTRWLPAPHDDRPWIQVDLGDSVFFEQVCVASDAPDTSDLALRVAVSGDGQTWTDLATVDELFTGPRIDLGVTVPPCFADCPPLHVQADPVTWQIFAINHTAVPIVAASISARIYEPFGKQLSQIEQREVTIEPLSVAAGFVVSRPAYFSATHLISLQLHDADGVLLCEHNCWRYRAEESPHGTAGISAL
ncbi:discoidin domain-containing protein [Actinocrinis sp.]|uniref:discoidin domain-containing protein n=1 Tax=Actinocrinis sp. TaxID=1920516 RepID=UPI002D8065E1|nr:discoidin domain-containing protein [Actinocrinis sp.]